MSESEKRVLEAALSLPLGTEEPAGLLCRRCWNTSNYRATLMEVRGAPIVIVKCNVCGSETLLICEIGEENDDV